MKLNSLAFSKFKLSDQRKVGQADAFQQKDNQIYQGHSDTNNEFRLCKLCLESELQIVLCSSANTDSGSK